MQHSIGVHEQVCYDLQVRGFVDSVVIEFFPDQLLATFAAGSTPAQGHSVPIFGREYPPLIR